jgi:hypothetical protein
MSMAFGDGGPYGALVQAMAQRRQRMAQQAPQQQPMQPLGGTMELRVPQMPQMSGAATNGVGGAIGGMSASSMADMLKRMRGNPEDGRSFMERLGGARPDLGSRMGEFKGQPLQTYDLGQAPTGGLY